MIFHSRAMVAATSLLGAVVATIAVTHTARGDTGLSLPPVSDEEIRGVRFGEFVFIPAVGLEGRFNSNVFRQDPSNEGRSQAGILSVRPGWRLTNPQPSLVRLTWDANLGYSQFFSSDENAKKQGKFTASTGLRADFLPRSVVGFFIADNFVREAVPRNFSTTMNYNRNFNHAEAGIQVRPGGGALEIAASYAFNFDLFDDFSTGNLFYHQARLITTWDFFPKTTFLVDADFRVMDWRNEVPGFRTKSMPLRASTGVRGFITKKVAFLVKVGYGRGFYKSGPEYQSVIGEASLGFKPTPYTLIDFGYVRDFSDSYFANYYGLDGAYLKFGQQVARRVNFEVSGRYNRIAYGTFDPKVIDPASTTQVSSNDRRDNAVTATAQISYSVVRWVALAVGYQFEGIFTDFKTTDPSRNLVDWGGYQVHQVFGSVTLLY